MEDTAGGALILAAFAAFIIAIVLVPTAAVVVALLIVLSGKKAVASANTNGDAAESGAAQKVTAAQLHGIGWRRWTLLLWGLAGAATSAGGWLHDLQRRGRVGSLSDGSNLVGLLPPFGFIAGLGFFGGILVGVIFVGIFCDAIDSWVKRMHERQSGSSSGRGA